MAKTATPRIWATPKNLHTWDYKTAFEPVYEFDQESGSYTDRQQTVEGIPVWKAQATALTGWLPSLTVVEIRALAEKAPRVNVQMGALVISDDK